MTRVLWIAIIGSALARPGQHNQDGRRHSRLDAGPMLATRHGRIAGTRRAPRDAAGAPWYRPPPVRLGARDLESRAPVLMARIWRSTRLAWWKTLPAKVLLESAWKAKNFVRVIEYGERILVRNPWDRRTQMIMSEAADALGLTNLAMWILEQAWQKETHTPALNRALARLYEKRGHLPQAIALWKLMLREDPEDGEAQCQLNNLGAKETLVRGQYEQMVANRPVEVA